MLTSYRLAIRVREDVLSILGFTKSYADEQILGGVIYDGPDLVKPNNMAQILVMSGNDKAALAKDLCTYIRDYCNSQEFKDKYEAYRQSQKPSVQQLSEEEKSSQLEMIAQQEEMMTPEVMEMLPAEARANALQSIEELKATTNGELTATQKADWEAKAPSDPWIKIKKGLQQFLDETKDVDFNATTFLKDDKKIFSNPAYEEKSGRWKACYRAGKEVSEVARNFAKEWLIELN
jgi:hypothetical protein